ncbi:hypothetical protein [Massilia sp. MS-15]|uniref:hypothetical protein n=1 Tax=Massilia sp. MS-15 TaxID=2878200 RepID=UPI001CD594FB|nr:hypothetical protein [Massilia sp. MS-15]MCA1245063.1 hypothetical protein [Massilia sp. MS-15]
MVIGKGRLRHIAAGLLGKFISRNNNLERLWAPGVLYTEAQAAGNRVGLDLLQGRSTPALPEASSVARTFAAYLRSALARHGFPPEVLADATIALEFGLPSARQPGDDSFGDLFACRITLATHDGKTVSYETSAHCAAHLSHEFRGQMAMREAAYRLFQAVLGRDRDEDGRLPLEILREQATGDGGLVLDLLAGRGEPSTPAVDAVARTYAGQLRALLGAWMSELRSATVGARFYASSRNPQGSVFVDIALVTLAGRRHWFNGGGPMLAPPPWETPSLSGQPRHG